LENTSQNITKLEKYIKSECDMAKKDDIKILDPEGKTVLDFGCSGGQYSKIFLEAEVSHIYCYDLFEEPLKYAKQYLHNYSNHTITKNLADVPDNSIDIFFARLSIPYINIYKFFDIVDKKLKKDGLIYIRYHSFFFYKKHFFSNPVRSVIALVNYLLIKTIKKSITIKIKGYIFNDIMYDRESFKNYHEVSYIEHIAPIIILQKKDI